MDRDEGRISGVQFKNFIIDGEAVENNQNGIKVEMDNDAVVIDSMATINLNYGIYLKNSDAAIVTNNILAEVYRPLYLVNSGKSNTITNNRIGGAGQQGYSIFLEGQYRALVSNNQIYPDGKVGIVCKGCKNALIANNRLQNYCKPLIWFEAGGSIDNDKNSITGNYIQYSFGVSEGGNNGVDINCFNNQDNWAMIDLGDNGNNNFVSGNFMDFSETTGAANNIAIDLGEISTNGNGESAQWIIGENRANPIVQISAKNDYGNRDTFDIEEKNGIVGTKGVMAYSLPLSYIVAFCVAVIAILVSNFMMMYTIRYQNVKEYR